MLESYSMGVPISLQDLSYGGTHRGGKLPLRYQVTGNGLVTQLPGNWVTESLRPLDFIKGMVVSKNNDIL